MQLPFTVVFESVHAGPCRERALVLQSQSIPAQTLVDDEGHRLLVPEEFAAKAFEELASYDRENRHWKPVVTAPKPTYLDPRAGLAGYVLAMLFAGWAAGVQLFELNWFDAGKVNAGLVMNGELWRTVTALSLHADVGHLAGNLGFGALFGYFAGQFFGSGVGWLAILMSGAAGNTLNSYLNSPSHTSVGASTAIFGALGLVAAYSWRRQWFPQDRWVGRVGPIAGGVALLAFTGTGGERTDIGAHLTGFISGIALGVLLAWLPSSWLKSLWLQWSTGLLAAFMLAASWYFALAT